MFSAESFDMVTDHPKGSNRAFRNCLPITESIPSRHRRREWETWQRSLWICNSHNRRSVPWSASILPGSSAWI